LERASIAENAIALLYWGDQAEKQFSLGNEDVLAEVPHALRGNQFFA